MKKFRTFFKRILVAILSIAIILGTVLIPSKKASAGGYFSADLFTVDRSKKGTQSFRDTEKLDTSNIFVNVFMETSFPNDGETNFSGYDTWTYKGTTYHFKYPEGLYSPGVIYANITENDFTLTAQMMLRYDPNKARLIEPSARPFAGSNYQYYSPNMSDPAVVKEFEAYFDYLTHHFSSKDAHIDAWVCGNEVNAPDRWNFFGSDCMANVGGTSWIISDQNLMMDKYTKFYNIVYDAVKAKNKKARVCICVDHCWTETDGGRMFPTKSFLNKFAEKESSKDWCIAFHAYPADLTKPQIWADGVHNPKNENALFVDGYNLEVLTGYVKSHFGTNHRILLTEQGFSSERGANIQAASLVYTFYKARFDDMIDVFHILKFPGIGVYELQEPAATIWKYLDDGSDEHEQWILSQVAGTIGISSFSQITPNWKSQGTLKNEINNYKVNNKYVFDGIDYEPVFDYDYFVENNRDDVVWWYTGYKNVEDQKKHPPKEEDMFYYFARFGMMEGRKSSPNFDLEKYKSDHPELVAQYGDDNRAYYTHYCTNATVDPEQVKAFVVRFYKVVLDRSDEDIAADSAGVNDWTNKLISKEKTGADVARGFAMSKEFKNKGLGNKAFVTKMYKAFFDRDPDEAGFNGWVKKLEEGYSREYVLAGFVNSQEFKNLCKKYGIKAGSLATPAKPAAPPAIEPLKLDASEVKDAKLDEYVERLYTKILKRESEPAGKADWSVVIKNGQDSEGRVYDAATVASKGFFKSAEYKNQDTTNAQFVLDCYMAFFNRDPRGTDDEVNYQNWVNQLNSEQITREYMIEKGFGKSKEFKNLLESYGFKIVQ